MCGNGGDTLEDYHIKNNMHPGTFHSIRMQIEMNTRITICYTLKTENIPVRKMQFDAEAAGCSNGRALDCVRGCGNVEW